MSTPLAFPCTFVYSVDLLRSLNTRLVPPSRQTRKTLFRFQLWRPAYLRRHATSSSSCLQQPRQQPRQPPRLSSSIRAATLNPHSLTKKYVPVSDFIESSEVDVMVIVESWHHSSADAAVRPAAPPGFHFRDRPRYDDPLATERGGGIIVYHRDHLKVNKIELVRTPTTFEALAVSLASDRGPTTLLALYRPCRLLSTVYNGILR